MFNELKEWWWIYDMCKKPKLEKCSKNDDFLKEFISIWTDIYTPFLIHLDGD
jgi:hypothetical protein